MRVAWVPYDVIATGAPGASSAALARGYFTAASHLRDALTRETVLVGPREAWVHIHVCPPHAFRPVRERLNVLFTMWETEALPADVLRALRLADALIVPSRFCRDVWAAHGLGAHVVPLGVADAYLDVPPARPRRGPLRFLALGSPIARKGWDLIGPAFRQAFAGTGADVSLCVKLIGDGSVHEHYSGRVILDQRDLSEGEMRQLYAAHDVFVFPSHGEGFGLPALEAMAAGCLVVATDAGGLADFVGPETALVVPRSETARCTYGVPCDVSVATVDELAAALSLAQREWGTAAMERPRLEGARIARTFTWTASARTLASALATIARDALLKENAA